MCDRFRCLLIHVHTASKVLNQGAVAIASDSGITYLVLAAQGQATFQEGSAMELNLPS